jgi:flagellar protein FliO/FliZ
MAGETEQIRTVALALLGVLALVLVLAALLKRWRLAGPAAGASGIQVVAASHLGPKERLVLVRVRDRDLLIGVSPGGLARLGEFAAEEGAPSLPQPSAATAASAGFWRTLQIATGRDQ